MCSQPLSHKPNLIYICKAYDITVLKGEMAKVILNKKPGLGAGITHLEMEVS